MVDLQPSLCTSNQQFWLKWNNAGFKKGHSAVNHLAYMINHIQQGRDKGMNSMMIFLDIKSAFDRVWHKGHISKLAGFGIDGVLLDWFTSYLSNRKQHVNVNGIYSNF